MAGPRERLRGVIVDAHRRLLTAAAAEGRHAEAADHAARILALDAYDERAHESLVQAHTVAGAIGDARRAESRYRAAMIDLGVSPPPPRRLLD